MSELDAALLYPYQRDWAADDSRFKIGMFARQTGKTFTTTLEIGLDCVQAESEGRRERWVILSRGERQAREAMREGVQLHLSALNAVFRESERTEWINEKAYSSLEVELPGGSRITALPANPDTARGFSANVMLDEFAFHQDSRAIWKALFPVVSKNGLRLRVVSTPNGKGNKFHELMTDKGLDGVWSRHEADIYRAVADGLPRDIEELKAGLNDDEAWAQEYELQWLDETTAWLPYELISSVEHAAAGDPSGYQGGPCYVGNDIARRGDLWIATVLEQVGDVLWERERVELKNAPFASHDEALDELVLGGRYDVRRIDMDQTGMGEKPVEDAKRRYGASRVEGVLFTAAAKQGLATQGKEAFQDRRVRIPMGEPALRKDLHALRKTVTPAGNVRFEADRDANGHADRAWALLLAIEAASGGTAEYAYHPAPSPRRSPAAGPGSGRGDYEFMHSDAFGGGGDAPGWRRYGGGAL